MSELFERFKAAREAIITQNDEEFLDCLSDDIEYHYHVGTRPLIGKDWVKKSLEVELLSDEVRLNETLRTIFLPNQKTPAKEARATRDAARNFCKTVRT